MKVRAKRANDLMALSRERIADELLKLLGMPDPVNTVRVMLDRAILKPVVPEIEMERVAALEALITAEREAEIDADALRRLAALLPRDAALAADIATRLRFSNKAKKRLECSAIADLGQTPRALAYHVGNECAVDRLLSKSAWVRNTRSLSVRPGSGVMSSVPTIRGTCGSIWMVA